MPRILLVSKPVAPPWNDSGKNLVRDLAESLTRHEAGLLTTRDAMHHWSRFAHLHAEPLYGLARGAFSPGLRQNLRVLSRVAFGARADVYHYFFAPNPRSSGAARALAAMGRRPTVQTVSSAPRAFDARLFFADRVVVLSGHTERRLLACGVARARIVRIPAGIEPLAAATGEERAAARVRFELPPSDPVVVYPGDYELGGGAQRLVSLMPRLPGVLLVLACRSKTEGAERARASLASSAESLGVASRVRTLGHVGAIHDLLRAADVVALPSTDLWAKMDQPLVLLEAMSLGRPVVVARGTPAEELSVGDAALAVADDDDLATALGALTGDRRRARTLGERGRAAVCARYHRSAMAAAYERLYDELTA